jgi:hypothetical protein
VQLVGAGGDEVGEVAELQLGVAEEGGVGGGGEGACDLGEEVIGALADGVSEFLGEGLLLGGELGKGHEASLATRAVDFWPIGRSVPLCTKIPPTVETLTRFPQFPPFLLDARRLTAVLYAVSRLLVCRNV